MLTKAILVTVMLLANGGVDQGINYNGFQPEVLDAQECQLKMERNQFLLGAMGTEIIAIQQFCVPLKSERKI